MTVKVKRNIPRGHELERLLKRANKIALETIGVVNETEIKRRFEVQGPGWTPLKESTIERKGSSSILIDTGLMLNSISYEIDENEQKVRIGIFTKERALIGLVHERGSIVRKIPKRPFMIPAQLVKEGESLNIIRTIYSLLFRGQLK
jgi:hypothetical protein